MQFTEMVIKCVHAGCLWLSSRAHSLFKSTYRIFALAFANKRVRYERLRRGRAHIRQVLLKITSPACLTLIPCKPRELF